MCSAFPSIHKGGQVVGELIIGGKDGEDLGVGAVEELDGMGGGSAKITWRRSLMKAIFTKWLYTEAVYPYSDKKTMDSLYTQMLKRV